MSFHVGQKVVCVVAAEYWRPRHGETLPQKEYVYTIRTIHTDGTDTFFKFFEVVNEPRLYDNGFVECDFHSLAFRPVIERNTDISVFAEMLLPSSPKKLERV